MNPILFLAAFCRGSKGPFIKNDDDESFLLGLVIGACIVPAIFIGCVAFARLLDYLAGVSR